MATNISINGSRVSITTSEGDALRQSQQVAQGNPLENLTLMQALTWIDTNVNDLSSARAALKHLAKLVFITRAELRR